ncbi:MAG TPA: hypothetical protein VNO30_22025 [Kofleriaceae bacterium]|nr:hypothetical protein [Kofleriaceae bacterium]
MRNVTDTSADPPLRRGADRRMMAIVLAGVAAACLIIASFSKSWMGNPSFSGLVRDRDGSATAAEGRYMRLRGDIRFGPMGFERCPQPLRGFEDEDASSALPCESLSTEELNAEVASIDPKNRDRYTSGVFSHAGWIAFGTCLVAAAALLAAAALAFLRVRKDMPVSPASVALLGLMFAMASGCVFIATKPGPAGMLGVDLGFWAFGAGTVLGILGAQMLAKELRPVDPDLLDGALNPADFAAFPSGREAAPPAGSAAGSAVPAALPAVAPTQPVLAILDVNLGVPLKTARAAEPAEPGDDSPGDAKKPGEVS